MVSKITNSSRTFVLLDMPERSGTLPSEIFQRHHRRKAAFLRTRCTGGGEVCLRVDARGGLRISCLPVRPAAANICSRTDTRCAEHRGRGAWSVAARSRSRPKGRATGPPFKARGLAAYGGPHEPARRHSHLWRLLPDPDEAGKGEETEALPAFEDPLLPSQNGDVLELDELWSFGQKKTQECWLWVALCRRTRQVVTYTIGDRSQEGAAHLRAHVPDDYRRRATRSDYWLAYEAAFPQRTHRCGGKEAGETDHVERRFGTVRARLGRLGRRAYAFSRSVERHLEAIHLFITGYNLQIKDSTLL